jgi:biotin transport system substrate-specific component
MFQAISNIGLNRVTSSSTGKIAAAVGGVFLGSAAITVAAKISIPVWPVPVTLQSMAVALVAGTLGFRRGVGAVLLYLSQGALGLPVFAGALAGPVYLLGPTGGFLVGFLLMAALTGWLADKGAFRNPLSGFATLLAADTLVFAFGFAWLLAAGSALSWVNPTAPLASAFDAAIRPFIAWDVLKMAFAALTLWGACTFTRFRSSSL